MDVDPKVGWAVRNLHLFPVEINRAEPAMLLRVPGIGRTSLQRIVLGRRYQPLNFDNLQKMGVVLKRARYFITCGGKSLESKDYDALEVRRRIATGEKMHNSADQLLLFPESNF
jgi:predicted DNA-binding helix-hairpin-helix protein